MPRIPFGLDRLPDTLAPEDPRLPAATVGAGILRLNSEPLPPAFLAAGSGGHDDRVAALLAWLEAGCGDYARPLVGFMRAYVDFLEATLAAHRHALAAGLARFDGLYVPRDWLWSAPRPLPRAWLPTPEGPRKAAIAFWIDGAPLAIGLDPDGRDSAALRAAGIAVLALTPATLAALLPPAFHCFWDGPTLPASPFRRAVPPAPAGAALPWSLPLAGRPHPSTSPAARQRSVRGANRVRAGGTSPAPKPVRHVPHPRAAHGDLSRSALRDSHVSENPYESSRLSGIYRSCTDIY